MSERTDKLEEARSDAQIWLNSGVELVLREMDRNAPAGSCDIALKIMKGYYDTYMKATEDYRASLSQDVDEVLERLGESA